MMGNELSGNPYLYLLVPFAFLIGSIPFGIIFTRNRGIDIRNVGSKNIGATNVLRFGGKKAAILTLLGDVLKGAVPVLLCKYVLIKSTVPDQTAELSSITQDLWLGIVGLSAVLGHMLSVFLSFRGGKGVATGFGFMLVYSPAGAGIMLLLWLAAAFSFKYSALAALIAVSALPIVLFLLGSSSVKITAGVILAALIVYKHKSNIRNLLAGTEDKIGSKDTS